MKGDTIQNRKVRLPQCALKVRPAQTRSALLTLRAAQIGNEVVQLPPLFARRRLQHKFLRRGSGIGIGRRRSR